MKSLFRTFWCSAQSVVKMKQRGCEEYPRSNGRRPHSAENAKRADEEVGGGGGVSDDGSCVQLISLPGWPPCI